MGHRRASESRSEKNAKEEGRRLGKTVGQKVGSVGRARNKDIRVRGRNSFLFQERLPRDRLSSASRRSEGKRGRGEARGRPPHACPPFSPQREPERIAIQQSPLPPLPPPLSRKGVVVVLAFVVAKKNWKTKLRFIVKRCPMSAVNWDKEKSSLISQFGTRAIIK